MKRPNIPIITPETIRAMEDMSWFTHALIFDDLLIVAQRETNCFVLKTTEGLIVIDAIWPSEKAFQAILAAIRAVGWKPEHLKKLLLTHGHADHTGCGRWLVERYQVETFLSQIDDIFWREHPIKPDRPETWKDYAIDRYLQDGDTVTLGDKTIVACATPGHTPGGLSYLFPVMEGGQQHMAALWGGTTPPRDPAGIAQYLQSLDHFTAVANSMGADVALSNHTAIDQGLDRIAYSRHRMDYMPNIYCIGSDGFQRFCQVFHTLSDEALSTPAP